MILKALKLAVATPEEKIIKEDFSTSRFIFHSRSY